MRIVLTLLFVVALALGVAAFQSEVRQVQSVRFEPPAVVGVVDVVYPLQSVASGTVVLEVSLDEDGKITGIRVIQGIASLTEPAEYCVQQWKFKGAKLDGKPIASKIVTSFSFVPPNVGPRW